MVIVNTPFVSVYELGPLATSLLEMICVCVISVFEKKTSIMMPL